MNLLNITPTRSNLMAAQKTLSFAREGYDILDKKREVLLTELIHIAQDATQLQATVWSLLADAYRALEEARLSMGREHLEWAALSVNKTIRVTVTPRSVMGVPVPTVSAQGGPPEVSWGMGNTTVALDEATSRFRSVLDQVPRLAEKMTTAWRLARDLHKTQRRVNALQYLFIPQYEQTVAYIEGVLEEREREELFRLKRVKSMHALSYEAPEPVKGSNEGPASPAWSPE